LAEVLPVLTWRQRRITNALHVAKCWANADLQLNSANSATSPEWRAEYGTLLNSLNS
jgi:hypothetical protein